MVAVAAGLAVYHALALHNQGATDLRVAMFGAFGWLCFVSVVSHFHRDVAVPDAGTRGWLELDALWVTVIIPVMNEDPAMFRACLNSLAAQTRPPQRVHVIENGTPKPTMDGIVGAWLRDTAPVGLSAGYTHTTRPGKRSAQGIGVRADPLADVYCTIDSDVALEPNAMEQGLAPFVDGRVMSVGGMPFGANTERNLLTRLVELGYACSFLNGRAAYSMVNSVNVQCGVLAWYRGWVWRKNLHHYLTHTVAGRHMQYGDDAMLTRYAALEGHCLLQIGAVAQTLHPANLRHLTKQRIRWWRSFFWGNDWLLRAMPPRHPLWWITIACFVRFAWFTMALAVIVIVRPLQTGQFGWLFFAWVIGTTYLQASRYLTVRAPGRRFRSQLWTWTLAPAAAILNLYLGTCLQIVGLATFLKTGWSTRQDTVEVGLDDNRRVMTAPTGRMAVLATVAAVVLGASVGAIW